MFYGSMGTEGGQDSGPYPVVGTLDNPSKWKK